MALVVGVINNIGYSATIPCPVVTDLSLAQMAQHWAVMFKDPYCGFIHDRYNILLKQKLAGGVFGCARQLTNIYKTAEETTGSYFFKTIDKTVGTVDRKNMGAREIANAKVRTLRTRASVTAYNIGKNAFEKAVETERVLQGFSAGTFDFSSKQQSQKDAAKLAGIMGLIRSHELKLLSALKMMHTLEGRH